MTDTVTGLRVLMLPSPDPLSLIDRGAPYLCGETDDNGAVRMDPLRASGPKPAMSITQVLANASRRGRRTKQVVQ